MPFIGSHAIRRVAWREGTLSVRFPGGDRQGHADMPEGVCNGLLAAGWAGGFFGRHMRGACPFRKLRG